MNSLTDNSLMPIGKFKGTKIANVPANHLLWFESFIKPLIDYIEENRDVLEMQAKKEKEKY